MEAGEQREVDVRGRISLTVGDAGVFSYSINGMPARPMGGAGEVITVVFNAQTTSMPAAAMARPERPITGPQSATPWMPLSHAAARPVPAGRRPHDVRILAARASWRRAHEQVAL
jgi:hypothetical protein